MNYYVELVNNLSNNTIIWCLSGLIILLLGLYFNFRNKSANRFPLWLFLSVTLFGIGFIQIDHFLFQWDEQFHALVAKNLMTDPFTPRLMNGPDKTYPANEWFLCDIWLHKQPLFLWQMALSLKCFGVNLIALRLPSVLLHALTSVFVYSISKRYLPHFYSVLAAVLYGFSGYLNDFSTGAIGMDHNDIAFFTYVTGSFWALLHYWDHPKLKWAIYIGAFAGAAVLTKWLVGLVVFSGWGMSILLFQRSSLLHWKHLFSSFGIALLLVLPWQIYCYVSFPSSYLYELHYNSRHFTEVLEGHTGDWLTYFDGMRDIYGAGDAMRYFVLIGLCIGIYKAWSQRSKQWFLACFVFIEIYVFFTLAATKLNGYTIIVACFGFIFLLLPFQTILNKIPKASTWRLPPILSSLLILILLTLHFHPRSVIERHLLNKLETKAFIESNIDLCVQEIKKHPNYQAYYLDRSPNYHIPAVRFITGKNVYKFRMDKKRVANSIVLDVSDVYTHMIRRLEQKKGTIWR